MTDKETLAKQNLSDLAYVIQKLVNVINGKELDEVEQKEIIYCEKITRQVIEKIKIINS